MGEYRSTRGEKPPETTGEKRRRTARNVLRVLIVLAVLAAAALYIQVPRRVPASGYATTKPYAEVLAAFKAAYEEVKLREAEFRNIINA